MGQVRHARLDVGVLHQKEGVHLGFVDECIDCIGVPKGRYAYTWGRCAVSKQMHKKSKHTYSLKVDMIKWQIQEWVWQVNSLIFGSLCSVTRKKRAIRTYLRLQHCQRH